MRECQLALRSRASSRVLIPVADNRIALAFNQVQIIRNDLAHGLLEPAQVRLLPRSKFAHFRIGQVLLLVSRGIIDAVPQRLKHRPDLRPPRLSEIRRVLNGTSQIEEHASWIVGDACFAVNADFSRFLPCFPEPVHSFSAEIKRAAHLARPKLKTQNLVAKSYSAFASCCGLVMAIVSPTSPTLKRAKRRTEMFSPSLPILLAISWCTVIPGSFTNGWSSRQTSS